MGQSLTDKRETAGAPRQAPVSRELDFHAWTRQQAQWLREGAIGRLDSHAIAEELIALGAAEYDKLESYLRVILLHMLKWDFQPERRSRGWALSVREHRRRVQRVLKNNPSLAPRVAEALAEAYQDARDEAAMETGHALRRFPETCPYDWQAVTQRDFAIDPPDMAS